MVIAQQPPKPVPESPYGPNAPTREPRLTDWQAPHIESEDEVLIGLVKAYSPENTGTDWVKVSQEMKARHFDRSDDWCHKRWGNTLDLTISKPWSQDEDDVLKRLKGTITNWDWEVITSAMAERGFHRDSVSFRNRWQDVLRPQSSSRGKDWSPELEAILVALRDDGHGFREISDQLERRGLNRHPSSLATAYKKFKSKRRQRE